ncbi:ubiquitin carboxyl-terminal hydrolase CYLD [Galendromus occidentalis]|uniref:ubiquitinyl hydrolase 1 n=1 Tax=Galendromus occidentalis TaxID=34638 RepID=A0AAJ6W085_9ACAR|nr:ubiquitin carboxyl-terminal hydrolase CYLD [Galendromus occidentalis]
MDKRFNDIPKPKYVPLEKLIGSREHKMHSNGDHRSPAERADTSGNLQIPYDDFVFEVGSPVGVMLPPDLRLGSNAGGGMAYGVVRWAGYINDEPMLGLEMDEDAFNGGYLNDVFYFECEPGKGFFARPEQCVPDERIQQMTLMDESPHDDHALTVAHDSLPGDFPPLFNVVNSKDLSLLVGRCKGIQGHHNSCYLDATLFAMFTTTSVFDFILDRPREEGDIPEYEEVTRVLKEDIVNSLRVHRFVGAAQVMKLRELLDKLGSVSGLTCEEKDPEEFLNCLTQMLQVEPFLHLSSGQSAHLYQMFVEKDEDLGLPWFQQILEQSFFQQELKLQQMPSVFIVQMPRFGRQFKVYPRVLPSFQLDMTDLLMNSPRPCHICASLAHLECISCYQQTKSIEKSTFCDACYNRKHLRLSSHQASSKRLTVSAGFQDFSSTKHLPRQTMELFALLCIETSHYVAFVKCGQQSNSPWVFFDSMADRQGQNNIPEVVNCDEIYEWLHPEKLVAHPDDRSLPPLVKKIVSDAYMCFYRSNSVAMYN